MITFRKAMFNDFNAYALHATRSGTNEISWYSAPANADYPNMIPKRQIGIINTWKFEVTMTDEARPSKVYQNNNLCIGEQ